MFAVQDAWVEGFCISQMDPESGTDMERVTGGKRLCCCSGDLHKQNVWNIKRKYYGGALDDKLCLNYSTDDNQHSFYLLNTATKKCAHLAHLSLRACCRNRLSCCCCCVGGAAELSTAFCWARACAYCCCCLQSHIHKQLRRKKKLLRFELNSYWFMHI